MNYFRLRNTGQIVSENEYRAMYPNISFPAVLVPLDADAIIETPAPTITKYQRTFKNGVKQDAKLNWVWDWDIEGMSPEEITAFEAAQALQDAATVARKVEELWQAADKYTTSFISGVAIGILTIGVISQKPKALAVSAWSSSIWTEYYIRKAAITATSAVNLSFSSFGPIPYSIPELQAELGL